MPDANKPIELGRKELDPKDEAGYREKIGKARTSVDSLKGNTPLGGFPKQTGTPILAPQRTQQAASALNETGGVQPRPPGSPLLSPQTADQIAKLGEAQKKQEADLEASVKEETTKEDSKDFFDLMDFNRLNEAERILNSKARRKEIESRLTPMKLEDLILTDEVTQVVSIVPEKFWVKFRSATPAESLFVKRLMSDEKTTSDQYLMEKFSIYQLTCSLVSINGNDLPSHMSEKGEPSEDLFMKKLKMVLKKSVYVISDLGINFYWFDLRVRRLLNPDDLKNG